MSIIQNIKKTINYSRKNGYKEAACAAWERTTAKYYADYTYTEPSQTIRQAQRDDKAVRQYAYKLSLIVPAFETNPVYLEELIKSCLDQTYEFWELILADASQTDIVQNTVKNFDDDRIRYIRLTQNKGIAENTNAALEYASGDYCGLLDHDDILTKDAVYEMIKAISNAIREGKEPIMIYSDEDKCDEAASNFYAPHIKTDFNFDLILTNNYICHFMVMRTDVIKELKIRSQYDGAQDFDLVLRLVSKLYLKEKEGNQQIMAKHIIHVSKVLYHWRCHDGSTAHNPQSKMYAYEAGRKALADFTKRVGWKADIRHNKHLGFYRIEYRNDVLQHRDDLAAVGGYVIKRGKIASGIYKGQPLIYAGYMNRMDLYQNVKYLDIRNLELSPKYWEDYEKITGHSYENTFLPTHYGTEIKIAEKQPDWMYKLTDEEIDRLNRKLSKKLSASGERLLLDPESIKKI